MNSLFVLRGKIQEIYGRHSRIFDKVLQFVLALVVFYLINSNIGFMKVLAQPAATLALAVICTFFPPLMTVLAAVVLILGHMYAASLGMLIVTGMLFFVMFVFYFRLTPKMAMVVLITPVAFMFKIPYVIPIACALVTGPTTIIAIILGTVTYYMIAYVKKATPSLQGEAADMMTQVSAFVKQLFLNKQMWVVIVAFVICFLLVYTLRRQAIDHAWKIAVAAGAVVNIVVIAGGSIVLGEHASYGSLIIGTLVSIVIGFILEFFFFSVDYMKSENLQFEDDEYYYYVKAVPKLAVSSQEKTIKKINHYHEPETDDYEEEPEITNRSQEHKKKLNVKKSAPKRRPQPTKGPVAKRQDMDDVDKVLLAESLKKELKKKY